jgi:hypothetical protein
MQIKETETWRFLPLAFGWGAENTTTTRREADEHTVFFEFLEKKVCDVCVFCVRAILFPPPRTSFGK